MWNVFEYPFVGFGIAIVSMVALWIFAAIKPEKKRKWHYAIPFAIAAAAFAVSYFVQTDKEKIVTAANRGVRAFEEQKIEPIEEIIADDYTDPFNTSKEYIIAYCQALFQTATVEKITVFSRQVEIQDEKAYLVLEALVKFTEQSRIAQMGKPFLIVKARFHFKKTPQKKWLVSSSEILELDRKTVNWNQLRE